MTDLGLRLRILQKMDALERAGLKRILRPPTGIDLSSTDYLGLSQHERIVDALAQGARQMGAGSTASRLLRGDREIWHELERLFAQFKNTEAALYFSTGYAANIGVMSSFLEEDDVVFSDTLNHASLIDGIRLGKARRVVFAHADANALEDVLRRDKGTGQKWIVTESLFSMDGDFAPLSDYATLCRRYNAALIVDEAHAVGIYGPNGRGWVEEMGLENNVFLTINTAGKALGVAGALVAGPQWAIDYLTQRARTFIFSTAAPPSLASALLAALQVIVDEPWRRNELRRKSELLHGWLRQQQISTTSRPSHIVPIVIGENRRTVDIAEKLQSDGFDVRAIRPPTVPIGTSRLRVAINVNLSDQTLSDFASSLARLTHQIPTGTNVSSVNTTSGEICS